MPLTSEQQKALEMAQNNNIPYGYCHCGCGQKTTIIKENSYTRGLIKGEPRKYLKGHHTKGKKLAGYCRENNPNWRGGEYTREDGYVMIYKPDHPLVNSNDYIRKSRVVVENNIKEFLPKDVIIHHINHNRSDDRIENLQILTSHAEHRKVHADEKALKACGYAHWRKCRRCHQYDDPVNMICHKRKGRKNSFHFYHKECPEKI